MRGDKYAVAVREEHNLRAAIMTCPNCGHDNMEVVLRSRFPAKNPFQVANRMKQYRWKCPICEWEGSGYESIGEAPPGHDDEGEVVEVDGVRAVWRTI